MRVRQGTREDLDSVIVLERSAARAPHWPLAAYTRAVEDGDHRLFVAEYDGQIVGFAVGALLPESAELESVAVQETSRGRGFGRALVAAVLGWATAAGSPAVMLEVREGSAGARRLYNGLGFQQIGMRPGYYTSPVEAAVVMRWEGPPLGTGGEV